MFCQSIRHWSITRENEKLMMPNERELLLQEQVTLYNNIAKFGDAEGRLLAELQIFPSPRIRWSFEQLGVHEAWLPRSGDCSAPQITGHFFTIEKPKITQYRSNIVGPAEIRAGDTARAIYGDFDAPGHFFKFYFPNFRCLQKAFGKPIWNKQIDPSRGNDQEVGMQEHGRYIEASLDENWSIKLFSSKDANKWLNSEEANIGTLLTTEGSFYQTHFKDIPKNSPSPLQALSLRQVTVVLEDLGSFMAFPNGGYLGPIYIESWQYLEDTDSSIAAVASQYLNTTLDNLSISWVADGIKLQPYLECFPTFKVMLNQSSHDGTSWKDTYRFVLAQYFQATSPKFRGWQVRASSIGSALERLSDMILVQDESHDERKEKCNLLFERGKDKQARREWNIGKGEGQEDTNPTSKRLCLMLERIGLTKEHGFSQDLEDTSKFLTVRNEAVHPRAIGIDVKERDRLIWRAVQWVEEVLLWRLGYEGQYCDRLTGDYFNTPRYDLNTRNPDW